VWETNAGRKEGGAVADFPSSEIVVPVANSEDKVESRDDGICRPVGTEDLHMEGRGGDDVFCDTNCWRNYGGSSSDTTTTAAATTSTMTTKAPV
jgi:hypothetical protein